MLMNAPSFSGLFALSLVWLGCLGSPATAAAEEPAAFSVMATGARADGIADDTAALQKALDEAAKAGGKVPLPAARFLVRGSLHIPPGVTLQGMMDSPVWSDPLKGSIILATARRHEAILWTQDEHFAGKPGVRYRRKLT